MAATQPSVMLEDAPEGHASVQPDAGTRSALSQLAEGFTTTAPIFARKTIESILILGVGGWLLAVASLLFISGAESWIARAVIILLATGIHIVAMIPILPSYALGTGISAAIDHAQIGSRIINALTGLATQRFDALRDKPLTDFAPEEVNRMLDAEIDELAATGDQKSKFPKVFRWCRKRLIRFCVSRLEQQIGVTIRDGASLTLTQFVDRIGSKFDRDVTIQLRQITLRTVAIVLAIEFTAIFALAGMLTLLPI